MERTWIDRQYHIQNNDAVSHKDVKMYCNTNQLPELTFCGQHSKSLGERVLIMHYHLRFYSKLGNGVCEIRRTSCACAACKSVLDRPWIYGIPPDKQEQ